MLNQSVVVAGNGALGQLAHEALQEARNRGPAFDLGEDPAGVLIDALHAALDSDRECALYRFDDDPRTRIELNYLKHGNNGPAEKRRLLPILRANGRWSRRDPLAMSHSFLPRRVVGDFSDELEEPLLSVGLSLLWR